MNYCNSGTQEQLQNEQFDRLYDPTIGAIMLVTQFVLGLKDELRFAMEAQWPDRVHRATLFAQIYEGLADSTKSATKLYKQFQQSNRKEGKSKFASEV
jgi:hypothetical protein